MANAFVGDDDLVYVTHSCKFACSALIGTATELEHSVARKRDLPAKSPGRVPGGYRMLYIPYLYIQTNLYITDLYTLY